ncbi:hypothetical protein [Mesorhizobium amorphae]
MAIDDTRLDARRRISIGLEREAVGLGLSDDLEGQDSETPISPGLSAAKKTLRIAVTGIALSSSA